MQDAIHDDARTSEEIDGQAVGIGPAFRRREDSIRNAGGPHLVPCRMRVPAQLGWDARHQDMYAETILMQAPGRHADVAAIVAMSCDQDDFPRIPDVRQGQSGLREGDPRPPHQQQSGDLVCPKRGLVGRPHLLCC